MEVSHTESSTFNPANRRKSELESNCSIAMNFASACADGASSRPFRPLNATNSARRSAAAQSKQAKVIANAGKSKAAFPRGIIAGVRSHTTNALWSIMNAFCLTAIILWYVNHILKQLISKFCKYALEFYWPTNRIKQWAHESRTVISYMVNGNTHRTIASRQEVPKCFDSSQRAFPHDLE